MNDVMGAVAWLTDPAQWSGASGIPQRVGEHLAITAVVVVIAALIALPAGVAIGHTRRGAGVVGAVVGAARSIPTLGLLTLFGLWLGIGLGAPMLALVVLAIPSLLAGAYAGIQAVPAEVVDAARAVGMSEWGIVWRVEVPLGAPVIVGGVRAATLQVVATATLAAYIADDGLGRFLFLGLETRDYPQMLGGAALVIVLAVVLEVALAAVQRGVSTRVARPWSAAGRSARAPRHPMSTSVP